MNSQEARLPGPSCWLLFGAQLVRLTVRTDQHRVCSTTDRQDFYHAARVREERAATNSVGPAFDLADLSCTSEYASFLASFKVPKDSRLVRGDMLHMARVPSSLLLLPVRSWGLPVSFSRRIMRVLSRPLKCWQPRDSFLASSAVETGLWTWDPFDQGCRPPPCSSEDRELAKRRGRW